MKSIKKASFLKGMESVASLTGLCVLIVLCAGCTLGGVQNLAYEDTLIMDTSAFPPGWRLIDSRGDFNYWRARFTFFSTFSTYLTPVRQYLLSNLMFLYYGTPNQAASAHTRFESNVFSMLALTSGDWMLPADLEAVDIQSAESYRVGCISSRLGSRDGFTCIYWALYGSCIIQFSGLILEPHFTFADYGVVITDAIDQQMPDVAVCYPP